MFTFSATVSKRRREFLVTCVRVCVCVSHPCIALASRKQGIAPTTDRYGGLSDKSWPDRTINYDGEFVRSFYNSLGPQCIKKKKKEKRKKKERENDSK